MIDPCPTPHEMTLRDNHGGELEHWFCATCGRELYIVTEPEFEMSVIVKGDTSAEHVQVEA